MSTLPGNSGRRYFVSQWLTSSPWFRSIDLYTKPATEGSGGATIPSRYRFTMLVHGWSQPLTSVRTVAISGARCVRLNDSKLPYPAFSSILCDVLGYVMLLLVIGGCCILRMWLVRIQSTNLERVTVGSRVEVRVKSWIWMNIVSEALRCDVIFINESWGLDHGSGKPVLTLACLRAVLACRSHVGSVMRPRFTVCTRRNWVNLSQRWDTNRNG